MTKVLFLPSFITSNPHLPPPSASVSYPSYLLHLLLFIFPLRFLLSSSSISFSHCFSFFHSLYFSFALSFSFFFALYSPSCFLSQFQLMHPFTLFPQSPPSSHSASRFPFLSLSAFLPLIFLQFVMHSCSTLPIISLSSLAQT